MSLDVALYIGLAITLYVAAVGIVRFVERRVGRDFGNRSLVFLAVFLVLLLIGLKLTGFDAFFAALRRG
jgi:hypothetical protein